MIIVDRKSYDDLFSATDRDLHFIHATLQDFDFTAVFKADIHNPTHTNVVRHDLNGAIPSITPAIVEEVNVAIDEMLDPVIDRGMLYFKRVVH